MKNNKTLYNLVNILFILVSALLVNYTGLFNLNFTFEKLIGLVLLLILIHVFKFIRIYFILLEESISLKRRIKIYIKTTFVSSILPYKIGELFKMYSYGHEIKNYSKGIIAILIDKFFDAIILCLILIPYGLINGSGISNISYFLLSFLIIILIIYFSFESTYYYLNKYFIVKSKNKKSLFILKFLENLNNIYKSAKDMLNGRQLILLILTAITWTMESIFVYVMSQFMDIKIKFIGIINYISDAFYGNNNVLFNNYIYLCTAIFLIVMLYIYVKKIIDGGKKSWKN